MRTQHTIDMKNILTQIAFIMTALAIISCSDQKTESLSLEPQTESSDVANYTLTKSQLDSPELSLGEFESKVFHSKISATGLIDVPPQNRITVSSYFGGIVQNLSLLPGSPVKKGQVLFLLKNPEYIQIQQQFLEAKSKLHYLEADYLRQKSLFQDSVSSEKNYLKAEADFKATEVQIRALKEKLLLMNISPSQLRADNLRNSISIVSPIDGYIARISVTNGTFLASSLPAISIVNTDHVHLELTAYAKDLNKLRQGQTINFRIPEISTATYNASVFLISKEIDAQARTVAIHGHFEEEISSRLSPGMYVEAEIHTTSDTVKALPQEAVVTMGEKNYVLILKDTLTSTYTFEKREVKTGKSDDSWIEILNYRDFKQNSSLLTKGAFNLLTE
jgi:cobalt-zinc-cadmium efflux system membrane fusion protein